jgi:hypothetical protein
MSSLTPADIIPYADHVSKLRWGLFHKCCTIGISCYISSVTFSMINIVFSNYGYGYASLHNFRASVSSASNVCVFESNYTVSDSICTAIYTSPILELLTSFPLNTTRPFEYTFNGSARICYNYDSPCDSYAFVDADERFPPALIMKLLYMMYSWVLLFLIVVPLTLFLMTFRDDAYSGAGVVP